MMTPHLRNSLLTMVLLSLAMSCGKKEEKIKKIFFELEPYKANRDSVLKIMLVNNTNRDYFISLDTTQAYHYSSFNYEINNNIILKPIVYDSKSRILYPKIDGEIIKPMGVNKKKDDCIEKESNKANVVYKDYKILRNAILIKKKSSKHIEIPFKLNYETCYFKRYYDLKKDKKYYLQLFYEMHESSTKKFVNSKKLDSLKGINIFPYYQKVLSNKILLKQ